MYSHSAEQSRRSAVPDARSADNGFSGRIGHGTRGAASMLMQLQRSSGNQAAVRLYRSRLQPEPPANDVVQRMRIVKDGKHRMAEKTDSPDSMIDTSKLSLAERNALVLELQMEDNEKLLDLVLKEWGSGPLEEDSETKLEELFDLGNQLAAMRKDNGERKEQDNRGELDEIARKVKSAQRLIDKMRDNPVVGIYRDVVLSLMRDLAKLEGKGIADQVPPQLNLQLGDEERDNYRSDMRQMGTWAGEAEAEKLAELLHVKAQVFVIRKGAFQLVTQVGEGNPAVGNLALVHLGNHYEVVRDVQDGMAKGGQSEWLETGKTGDCLFESMLLIQSNGQRAEMETTLQRIQQLRNQVADQLDDEAINETIQEMLVFGDLAGSGAKTSKLVKERRSEASLKIKKARAEERAAKKKAQAEALVALMDQKYINARMGELRELDQRDSYGFGETIGDYMKKRLKDPKSEETMNAASELDELFQQASLALRRQRGEFDLDFSAYDKDEADDDPQGRSAGPLDRPKEAEARKVLEKQARERTLSRDDIEIQPSPNNPNQHLITMKGTKGEFVIDKIGQLVPRFTRRNVSDINIEEMKGKHDEEAGMYPSNLSPYEDARKRQDARGTGDNKIKNESGEMYHVQGSKPSDFLSVTASSSNALNPQNKEFDAAASYIIDLSYLNPEHISSLYTSQGMRYFLLDAFGGDRGKAIATAEEEQKTKAPSAQELAKKHHELSAKEWQALLDVIRTKEVLIDCVIPEDALEKVK